MTQLLPQAVHNSEVPTKRHEEPASDIKEEALRAVFEHALDAVLIADDAGRYVAANAAAGLLLAVPPEELTGRRVKEFVVVKTGDFDELWRGFLAQGKSEGEITLRRSDGEYVEAHFRATANFVPGLHLSILRDITARKQAEERLQRLWRTFDTVLSNIPDFAYTFDLEGRFTYINQALLTLWHKSLEDAVGKNFFDLDYPPELAVRLQRQIQQVIDTRSRLHDETPFMGPTGEIRDYEYIFVPVLGVDGSVEAVAGSTRDITARKRAEQGLMQQVQTVDEKLHRNQEQLGALAGCLMTAQDEERRRIARELHDDLAQRLALLEMELEGLRQNPPGESAQLAPQLTPLIVQIAALSDEVRHLSHRLHPSMLEHLGLEPALRSLVEEFDRVHGSAVSFTSNGLLHPVPLPIATALYRITQEALRNAAKYAHGADVTVEMAAHEAELRLTIQDAGPGFDPEMVRAREGLGLVSMQERARLVGAHLVLRSAPGHRTVIEVRLPWPAEEKETPRSRDSSEDSPREH